ncbi:hypothetical protein ZTR_10622 [Talaromyces verruculosus]|nr:hypothetical protein ZTR_10622 [Talaromyces verruculosus]
MENRAVADETYRPSLIKGRTELQGLELRLNDIEDRLRPDRTLIFAGNVTSRYLCERVGAEALTLSKAMDAENQPMKRLRDAIAISQRSPRDETALISARIEAMNIATQESDNQITLSARLIYVKAQEILLRNAFTIMDAREKNATQWLKFTKPANLPEVMNNCRDLITRASQAYLSRMAISGIISFARISQLDAWYHRTHPTETSDLHLDEGYNDLQERKNRAETIRGLLTTALKLCVELGNCPELQEQTLEMVRLYEGPRYETVTLEELQSIKVAMLSGGGGIVTHAGHWYNCANGHPFAIAVCLWSKLDVLNAERLLEVRITPLLKV